MAALVYTEIVWEQGSWGVKYHVEGGEIDKGIDASRDAPFEALVALAAAAAPEGRAIFPGWISRGERRIGDRP